MDVLHVRDSFGGLKLLEGQKALWPQVKDNRCMIPSLPTYNCFKMRGAFHSIWKTHRYVCTDWVRFQDDFLLLLSEQFEVFGTQLLE